MAERRVGGWRPSAAGAEGDVWGCGELILLVIHFPVSSWIVAFPLERESKI